MSICRLLAALAFIVFSLGSLPAQRFSAGSFYGYRIGGEFENSATGEALEIEENPSYGVFFDIDPTDSGLRLELLYSLQKTELDLTSVSGSPDQDLDVHVFQVGGLQELYDGKFRPYVAGYIGATWFDLAEVEDDLRFSFTVGAGANYYFTENFGLRVDVRGIGTVVDSEGGFICVNGACVVNFSRDVLWQGEATASLFLAF